MEGWRNRRAESRPAASPPTPAGRPKATGAGAAAGWTLIELVVVVSLMSTLVAIAMVGYGTAVTRTREAVLKENLFRMRDAIDQFYADRQAYPAALEDLVTYGYVRAIPVDPFTNSSATWQVVPAPTDPNDLLATGVFDVRSGSDRTALDGSAYSGW